MHKLKLIEVLFFDRLLYISVVCVCIYERERERK